MLILIVHRPLQPVYADYQCIVLPADLSLFIILIITLPAWELFNFE